MPRLLTTTSPHTARLPLPSQRFSFREEMVPGAVQLSDAEPMNQSRLSGVGPVKIVTPPEQWAFTAGFPLRWHSVGEVPSTVVALRVTAKADSGRVGIGLIGEDFQSYIATERDWTPEEGLVSKEFLLEPGVSRYCGGLIVRNTAETGQRSAVTVTSIQTFRTAMSRIPDLVEADPPPIHLTEPTTKRGYIVERKLRILLTHTSREWDRKRCARGALVQRYSEPARLLNLPPFDTLAPPPAHLYSGSLSILDLAIDSEGPRITSQRYIESALNIQHAALIGERLVLCCENFLAALPSIDMPPEEIDLRAGSPLRIDDNWFSGLHTVFPVDSDTCLVSSSGCDAALWVDVRRRAVIRRWRLPKEIYGRNYDLTPVMAASHHYIHNDIQLGHLNCAYPDGEGGCYISTLAQGDIGHVNNNGRYSLLARGYVGCHGVRLAQNRRDVYFADSCSGRLMEWRPSGEVVERWAVDSNWLHDVAQADTDLYVLCLGDRNVLALVDLTEQEELCRLSFDRVGAYAQFVAVTATDA